MFSKMLTVRWRVLQLFFFRYFYVLAACTSEVMENRGVGLSETWDKHALTGFMSFLLIATQQVLKWLQGLYICSHSMPSIEKLRKDIVDVYFGVNTTSMFSVAAICGGLSGEQVFQNKFFRRMVWTTLRQSFWIEKHPNWVKVLIMGHFILCYVIYSQTRDKILSIMLLFDCAEMRNWKNKMVLSSVVSRISL